MAEMDSRDLTAAMEQKIKSDRWIWMEMAVTDLLAAAKRGSEMVLLIFAPAWRRWNQVPGPDGN